MHRGGSRAEPGRALIAFASYPTAPEKTFALGIVCDGRGGVARGDEAAVIAVSVFASRVTQWPSQPTGQPGGCGANQLVQFVGMGDGIAPRIIDADRNDFDSILITTDGVHCASPATFARADCALHT